MNSRWQHDTEHPQSAPADTDESLVTSEELFGDMVDTPSTGAGDDPPARRHKSPIRVRVAEPGRSAQPRRDEKLPEEMEALLDVLDAPAKSLVPPEVPAAGQDPQDPRPSPARHQTSLLGGQREFEALLDNLGEHSEDPSAPTETRTVETRQRGSSSSATGNDDTFELARLAALALKDEARTPPASAAHPPPGRKGRQPLVFGPYRLLHRIAVGGMADVFRAKRAGVEGFEKVLAIKRILPHLSGNKEFLKMFINEAKLVAGLAHPNVVQIFDLGRIHDSYYIAMEYVHGRDLRTIQKRAALCGARIPLDLAALIVAKVCSALEYAHRRKDKRGNRLTIVHRDVSPQNILISFEGDVKLTDFGIAKAVSQATVSDSGSLRGKLQYMSPEQASGGSLDQRSDLFSLGLVFYELITGQKPFAGSADRSVLDVVRECHIVPPRRFNPGIPEELESVVMKSLERDPNDRYQGAGEMYRHLDRVLQRKPVPAAPELARLMRVLFEEREREDDAAPEEGDRTGSGNMDVEFDTVPEPRSPEGTAGLSIKGLLRRFGVH